MKRILHKTIACFSLLAVCMNAYSVRFSLNGIKYDTTSGDNATVIGFVDGLSGDVIIPSSVEYKGTTYNITEVKDHAFIRANDITSVTVPEGVTTIGQMAFTFCGNLKQAKLPQSATNLDINIFAQCPKLTSVSMSNNIETIPDYMFQNCTSLTSVNIPGNLKKIGNCAFLYCERLETVNLPDGLTSIGESAFSGCGCLKHFSIPSTVTEIGTNAFVGCSMTEFHIPKGLVSGVNLCGLPTCQYLKTVTVDKENPKYYVEEGMVCCKNDTLVACPGGVHVSDIPSGIKAIASSAFKNMSGTFRLKFPSELTYIGEFAFASSGIMESISIPGTVKKISGNAFAYTSYLTSVVINEGTTEIGDYAFYNSDNLSIIHLPSSVEKIGRAAFYGCKSLSALTIPSKVKEIGEFSFGSLLIKEITLPSSIKNIPKMAFDNCKNLETVNLSKNTETIEYAAFRKCTTLLSVDLPASIKKVDSGAFIGCLAMKSINIEAGNEAYTSVDGVLMSGDKTQLVAFPGGITEGYTVPAYVKSVNGEAFHDALVGSVELSEGVESVGRYAFGGCSQLKEVTIPSSMKSIADYAFTNCPAIENVYVKCSEPLVITDNAFMPLPETKLYVPTGTKSKYEAATGWKNFTNILEKDYPTGISVNTDDATAEELSRYSLDGKKAAKAQKGISIVKMSNGKTVKVVVR